MMSTVGDVVCSVLRDRGVQFIFSVSGGPINALYRGARTAGIRLIHTRHEAAAGFMADAIGRLSGLPGVCATTVGPGVTNSLTPMMTANRAGVPVLFLAGQAPTARIHLEPGMSISHMPDVASPLCKWAGRVPSADLAEEYLDRAWTEMLTPRRGPVFLELPVDVQNAPLSPRRSSYRMPTLPVPSRDTIDDARAALEACRRPLLIVGDHAYWEQQGPRVRSFVETHGVPFAQLRLARGLVDESHDLSIGVGYSPANPVLREGLATADCVLLLGHDFESDLEFGAGVGESATVVHVYAAGQRRVFGRTADVPVLGSVAGFLAALEGVHIDVDIEWVDALRERWNEDWTNHHELAQSAESPMHPLRAVEEVVAAAPDDSLFVTSHGNVDFWADAHLKITAPGRYLRAGQSGSLGAEIPYGVAAGLLDPERNVVVFVGDGGVGFHGMELDTAARYGVPLLVVVLDDRKWGAIAVPQARAYGGEIEMDLDERDWSGVAEALGGVGRRVDQAVDIADAVAELIRLGRPAILHVPVRTVESPYMRYVSG